MERKLYISDLHLGHINVTKAGRDFDNRPFNDLAEMHETIKRKWNNAVSSADHVYILGDLVWKLSQNNAEEWYNYIKSLNGNKHWILGNHDERLLTSSQKTSFWRSKFQHLFDEIVDYKEVVDEIDGKETRVILSHYYMPFYNHHYRNAVMLHGHSHNSAESEMERRLTAMLNRQGYPCKIYNVGCMYPYIDYAPRTLQFIFENFEEMKNYGRTEREDFFEDVAQALVDYHAQHSQLRFGQTIVNLLGEDPFYMPDKEAIKKICSKIDNHSEITNKY